MQDLSFLPVNPFHIRQILSATSGQFVSHESLIFLEFDYATNPFHPLLHNIRMCSRYQFAKDVQPLFWCERLIVFEIRLVGFGKRTEDAGHFFHIQRLSLSLSGEQ